MKSFEALAKQWPAEKKLRIGVVAADERSVAAVFSPKVRELILPVLIGEQKQLEQHLKKINQTAQILEANSREKAAQLAVEKVKSGDLDCLMKGKLDTRTFLQAIVKKPQGLVEDQLLFHIAVNEIRQYHKLLLTCDGGMVLRPTKSEKAIMIEQSVQVMKKMGVSQPKVALLSAAENVNPKISASIEAEELAEQFSKRSDCLVAGPISLDLAVSPASVLLKGFQHPVAGDADIVIGPDITTMNVLGKSLTVFGQAKMAGVIIGATVPIVLTSRGATTEEKVNSLLLALYCAKKEA